MTAFTWKDGAKGNWYDAGNWSGVSGNQPYPVPGDSATIGSGTVTLDPADYVSVNASTPSENGMFDGLSIVLGDSANNPAELILRGTGSPDGGLANADIGSFTSITTAGSASIISDGLSTIYGGIVDEVAGSTLTIGSDTADYPNSRLEFRSSGVKFANTSETVVLTGNISFLAAPFRPGANVSVVNDAQVDVIGQTSGGSSLPSVNVAGPVTGTGSWNLGPARVEFQSSVAATQTVHFGSPIANSVLEIQSPSSFHAAITGFGLGDAIDFTAVNYVASDTVSLTNGALTLATSTGTVLATLQNVGEASNIVAGQNDTLELVSDSSTGTDVVFAAAQNANAASASSVIAAADLTYSDERAADPATYQLITAGAVAIGATVAKLAPLQGSLHGPIDGAGVKVGIISDSFDVNDATGSELQAAIAQGYLPADFTANNILREGPAGAENEGQAMAELVHAVAPGADIYFASAEQGGTSNQADYAAAFQTLQAEGCQVIVSDWTVSAMPMYADDGPVDAAVTNALNANTNILVAAGNFGEAFLQQSFSGAPTVSYTPHNATQSVAAHVWSNGTDEEAFVIKAGLVGSIHVQWTAPYEGVNNAGAPDALSFQVYTSTGAYVGTSSQTDVLQSTAPGAPSIFAADASLSIANRGSTDATYEIVVYLNNGQVAPADFNLVIGGSPAAAQDPPGYIIDPETGTGPGNLRGDALVPGVNTVGGTFYGDSTAYGQIPDQTEYYSDSGPGELLYDSNGDPYTGAQPGGVAFTAPTGVQTDVSGFNPFFGTSSASPEAGAAAALMLQVDPHLTNTQITDILEKTATPLSGVSGNQGGAGEINVAAAIQYIENDIACYCRGTLILTDQGEVAVEDLMIGDRIATLSGELRPIKWIGRRSYAGRFIMGRSDILPICFKAGALADNVPRRDLWISPHHAMYLEGVLIEARDLVNGASVTQADAAEMVEYFHIELDSHDIIIAEGAWSETFVDDDSRNMFHNAHEYAELYPETERVPAIYCRPRLDCGYEVEAARRVIDTRAGLRSRRAYQPLCGFVDVVSPTRILGWAQNPDRPEVPVCLDILVDGKMIGRTLANIYREDLAHANLGSGCHSFVFTLQTAIDPKRQSVSVQRSLDGVALQRSSWSCAA